MEQSWNPFLSTFFIFVWMVFFLKKHRILRNLFFDKIFPRIHKNELTYNLCTILEWDKCQQFAVFIEFLIFWFVLTQSCKKFVSFFFGPYSMYIQTIFALIFSGLGWIKKYKWGENFQQYARFSIITAILADPKVSHYGLKIGIRARGHILIGLTLQW